MTLAEIGAWIVGIVLFMAAGATVAALFLQRRNRTVLELGFAIQERPLAIRLLIRNKGTAATILRRGWARWGTGDNDRFYDMNVAQVALPSGGLLRSGPAAANPAVEVGYLASHVGGIPTHIGVEDMSGNSVERPVPDDIRALIRGWIESRLPE